MWTTEGKRHTLSNSIGEIVATISGCFVVIHDNCGGVERVSNEPTEADCFAYVRDYLQEQIDELQELKDAPLPR